MARPVTPLDSLGAKARAALAEDDGTRARAIETARRKFTLQALQPQRARSGASSRVVQAFALAAAAAFMLCALALWFFERSAPLRFDVDGTAGLAQTWLAAPSTRPLQVSFSDGTRVNVDPSSRARVVDTNAHGANIALESGTLHARVVHTSHSAWSVIAGPFAVRVTGTRFDVKWEPAAQQFSLAVLEGSVVVSGSIVGSERPVRAGEQLFASVAHGSLELQNAETAASNVEALPSASASAPSLDPAPSSDPPSATPTPEAARSEPAAWQKLAKTGDLRRAFAAAESHGFQSACDSATASELLLLGDGARLSGKPERATLALLALRHRYPRDPRRAAAAFALGKVAFDQQRAFGQAATWFATCVREQPNGPLAREAAGRHLEALRNAGDAAGAQQAARAYLTRYPDGPHADAARALLP